ncbi:hypothetical protein QR680_012226 [Steinernema hermaphroditum]|uniref:Uncharacterized protein n=1 Tax=Steinernema hermaphroditum TaxID=289476 RepID=A0AA39I420_9BILA|nr:hypothetical protein QR680_012226 [Steinernema hermaphroditum]
MAESRRDLFCFELIVEKVVRIADDARFAFDAIRFRVADFERETIPLAVPLELEDREASVSVGRSCYFFESEGFLDAISADSLHLELVHSSKSVSACSVFFADFASDGESSTLQCRGAIQMYSPETSARTCQLVITARLLKVETTSSALSARGAPSAPFRSTVCTSVAVQTSHKAKSRGVQVSSSKHMHDRSTQVRVRTIHKEEAACQTETFKEETPKPSTSSVAAQTDVCGSPKVDLKDKRFLKRLIDHLTKEIIGSILKKSRNRVPVDGYTKNSKLGFNVIPRLQMLRTLDRSIDTKVKMEASLQKELHKIRRNTLHELFKLRHEPPMPPYSLTVPITRGPRPMPPLKSQPAKKTVAVRVQTERIPSPSVASSASRSSVASSSSSRTASSSASTSKSSSTVSSRLKSRSSSASSSSKALSSLRSSSSAPSEHLPTAGNTSSSKTLTPPARRPSSGRPSPTTAYLTRQRTVYEPPPLRSRNTESISSYAPSVE